MGEPGIAARAACRLEMGPVLRARARAARHPGNRVLPRAPPAALRWADPVFARAAARAARHPGYGRTGYRPRAPPGALRWAGGFCAPGDIPVMGEPGLPARAPNRLEMSRIRFLRRRATSRLWANRVLPARARLAIRLEMGRSGFCARARAPRAHPGYGRTGYCPRAPPAALRWADPVLRARARAKTRDIPVMGEPGYCPRARIPAALRWADPVFARARARRATSRLWANRVLPARAASALRWADPVFARAARAPTSRLWAQLGIARARRLPP